MAMNFTRDARKLIPADRSSLGRFAMSEAAVLAAASIVLLDEAYNDITAKHKTTNLVAEEDRLTNIYAKAARGVERSHIYGEVFFWTGRTAGTLDAAKIFEWAQFLEVVATADVSYHDYMAVGIMDSDVIEKCIRDGVDAEMALRLVGA